MKLLNFQRIKHCINYILFREIQVFSLSLCLSKLWNHGRKEERRIRGASIYIIWYHASRKKGNLKLNLEYNSQQQKISVQDKKRVFEKYSSGNLARYKNSRLGFQDEVSKGRWRFHRQQTWTIRNLENGRRACSPQEIRHFVKPNCSRDFYRAENFLEWGSCCLSRYSLSLSLWMWKFSDDIAIFFFFFFILRFILTFKDSRLSSRVSI